MAAFKTHLLDKQSAAPALDPHVCRLGKWLQQACAAQRHAHSPLLARIIDMHNALHTQAEAMLQPPANDTSRSHTPSRLGTLSDALHAALLDLAEEPPSKALN